MPKPSNLGLESMLSCINTEVKQAIMLLLGEKPRSGSEIFSWLEKNVKAPVPEKSVYHETCANQLMQYGFVLKTGSRKYRKFELTKLGYDLGVLVSAYTMVFVVNNSVSMYDLLGPSFTAGKSSSPINRVSIADYIWNQKENTTITQISNKIGLSRGSVKNHLVAFEKLGMVDLSVTKAGDDYRWVKGKGRYDVNVNKLPGLTKKVVDYLIQNDYGNWKSIAKGIGYKYPNHVSNVLSSLKEQGLLTKESPDSNRKSNIKVMPRLKIFFDYVRDIGSAIQGENETLHMMTDVYDSLRKNMVHYMSLAFRLYAEVSPRMTAAAGEDQMEIIIRKIRAYQKTHEDSGPGTAWLCRELGIHKTTLYHHMGKLVGKGYVLRVPDLYDGRKTMYVIDNNSSKK